MWPSLQSGVSVVQCVVQCWAQLTGQTQSGLGLLRDEAERQKGMLMQARSCH